MLPNVFDMGLFSQLAFGHSEFFFKIWFLPLWACSQVRKPRRSKSPRLEDLDFCRSTKFNFLVYLIQVNPKVIQVLGERTSFHESSIFGTRFLSCLTGPLLGSALLYRSTSRSPSRPCHAFPIVWTRFQSRHTGPPPGRPALGGWLTFCTWKWNISWLDLLKKATIFDSPLWLSPKKSICGK